MGSTDHYGDRLRTDHDPPFVDFLSDPGEMERWLPGYLGQATAFFNRYLRGRETEVIPPVRWHLANGGWQEAPTWPPPGAQPITLHLAGNGLSADPDRSVSWRRWVHRPDDPVPDLIADAWRPLVELPDEQLVSRRPDVLTFTGEELVAPTVLAGPVTATLRVSSSAPSTHAVAKLVDVCPDGRARRIVEGIVAVSGTGDPDDARPATIDLGDTGYRLPAGHRLQLQIASSDFPRYAVHPGTDEEPMIAVRTQDSDQGLLVGGSEGSSLSVMAIG